MPVRSFIAVSGVLAFLSWLSPEQRGIEGRREELQERLAALPVAPVPQVTQRLGWHSLYSSSPDTAEWVELNLGQAQKIDAVVLIAPPPNGGTVAAGYGFPRRFYVELLGEGEDAERTIVADFTREDFPNPGLLPVVIPAGGRAAQKVRITATRLAGAGANGQCFFALGEVMLLQGKHNLGARIEAMGPAAVKASSSQGTRPDWGRINLVDGHTVLGPPLGTRRSPTLGFRSKPTSESRIKEAPWVEVDLGQVMRVDEVRLFPTHPPQFAHSHGYGFPVRYQIELREEDNDEPLILPAPQSGSYSAPPGDNVVTIMGGRAARHVRLHALEPHVSNGSVILALAEMQIWSGEKNVAPGSDIASPDATEQDGWSRTALVDGFASEADIVDWPEWLAGLSKRREALHELATLQAQSHALTQQWQRVGLAVLAGLVAAGIMAALAWTLRQRRARQADLEALRQRIARDLHDEIGSSLGSIALIAQDILAEGKQTPAVRDDLAEIKEIAGETVDAMRDITRLIQSDRYGTDDLPTLLRETAARMLRGLAHTVVVAENTQTKGLSVDRQRDLILMFKETLHNIKRHAAATAVDIRLSPASTASSIVLTVQDNGQGFDSSASTGGMGLSNLRRRATKHEGSLDITTTPGHGTTVCITLPLSRHA